MNKKRLKTIGYYMLFVILIIIIYLFRRYSELPNYKITDLGPLYPPFCNSDNYGDVTKINNKAQVIGVINNSVFLFYNGKMQDLGILNKLEGRAINITDKGQFVGTCRNYGGSWETFLYDNGNIQFDQPILYSSNGKMYDSIPDLSIEFKPKYWQDQFCPNDVNNKGQMVGNFDNHAFLYDSINGKAKDLGTFNEGGWSQAYAVNDKGQVVGQADAQAFIYSNGKMRKLGSFGETSIAHGINNEGQVVGESGIAWYRLLWHGVFLGPRGEVVHPFLYNNGRMYDLFFLFPLFSGWKPYEAKSINDYGQIVGTGWFKGEKHGFIMTPIYQ